MTMLMSIIVLTFVACGDESEDTAAPADSAVVDAVLPDTSEGEGEADGEESDNDQQDGGSENE